MREENIIEMIDNKNEASKGVKNTERVVTWLRSVARVIEEE